MEEFHYLLVALLGRSEHRCCTVDLRGIQAGPILKEKKNRIDVTSLGGCKDGRRALLIGRSDFDENTNAVDV